MRWWSIPIAVTVGWFLFTLTPFWALHDLAGAVQAGDADYVASHVNFRRLRLSLTRQLTAAIRAGSEGDERDRQRVVDAATALALPLAEALVTPKMVIDLLDDGVPQSLDLQNAAPAANDGAGGLRVEGIGRLGAYYLASDMRGFRAVVIAVPPDKPAAEQFKLRLRLRDWSWRLVDIELTDTLRERIAASLARASKSRTPDPRPPGEAEKDAPARP